MNLTFAILVLLYLLGLVFNKTGLRILSLTMITFYVFVLYIEASARYHRRCLRYHEEE